MYQQVMNENKTIKRNVVHNAEREPKNKDFM